MECSDQIHRRRLAALLSRRELFSRLGRGAGAMALLSLLASEAEAAGPPAARYGLAPKAPHALPRAKRIIYLFQNGGPSQVDLFDPKPELSRRSGEKPAAGFVNDVDPKKTGVWLGSPFR